MAIIYSYPRIDTVSGTDIMVLADSSEEDFATKSVTLNELRTFFGSGSGASAISVFYEGALVTDKLTELNFTGSGVNISNTSSKVTVNIPGGGGGGDTYTLATTQGSFDVDLDLISSAGSPSTITSTVKFTPGPGIDITAGSANDIQIENLNGLIVSNSFIEIQDVPGVPGQKTIIPDMTYRGTYRANTAPDNKGIVFSPLPPGTIGSYVYTDVDTAAGLKYDDGVGGTGKIQVNLGSGLSFNAGAIEATASGTETFSWLPTLCTDGSSLAQLQASDLGVTGVITVGNRAGKAVFNLDNNWIRYEFFISFEINDPYPVTDEYLIIAAWDDDDGKALQLPIDSTGTIGTNLSFRYNGSTQITRAESTGGGVPTYMWNRMPQTGRMCLEGTTYVNYLASLNYQGGVGTSGLNTQYANGSNWWDANAAGASCILAGTIIAKPTSY